MAPGLWAQPVDCRGRLGHGLVTSEDRCVSGEWTLERPALVPEPWGAPEAQLGSAREFAGVQLRRGGSKGEQGTEQFGLARGQ